MYDREKDETVRRVLVSTERFKLLLLHISISMLDAQIDVITVRNNA
jgi:hypothetical protein